MYTAHMVITAGFGLLVLVVDALDGVLEAHPRLRGGCIEQGAMWVPFWARRLSSHSQCTRKASMAPRTRASEPSRLRPSVLGAALVDAVQRGQQLRLQLLQVAGAALRRGVAAVQKGVQVDTRCPAFCRQSDGGKNLVFMAVNTAG